MTTDIELIRLSQNGNNTAFAELVRRHDRVVFGLIARYVAHAEDAKDVYQEVFLRVHSGLKAFGFRSQFATWLHRVTINTCVDHARRAKRSVLALAEPMSVADGDSQRPESEPVSVAPATDQRSIDAQTSDRIHQAIRSLPPRQRMVFVLRHEEEMSLKEIADAMGCGTGTIKRYLFEATRTMREELHDLLHEEIG
jgi:RNA polymerase sigma-70 factor, ECF subfamily